MRQLIVILLFFVALVLFSGCTDSVVCGDSVCSSLENDSRSPFYCSADCGVIDEPVVTEPIINDPYPDEPVVDEPVVDEPVVNNPSQITPQEVPNFFASGVGSLSNPYLITTCEELQRIDFNLTAHFALGNDINCSATRDWNGGNGFKPIGSFYYHFVGSLDGKGYTISNLFFRWNFNGDPVGLFSYASGNISNVGLINLDINNSNRTVGGLVGEMVSGKISNCYSTGNIVSGERFSYGKGGLVGTQDGGSISNSYSSVNLSGLLATGGLVGFGRNASISDSYFIGRVTGYNSVGGLVADARNFSISNSFSAGSVTGVNAFGGLVGSKDIRASAINSFWDVNTSGPMETIMGIGKTTLEMKNISIFSNWSIASSSTNLNNGYPFLAWQADSNSSTWLIYEGSVGTGTLADPRMVRSCVELQAMSEHPDWSYKLGNDINCYETRTWNSGLGFNPILGFEGSFDGNGYAVSGLYINRPSTDNVGLFGSTNGATIRGVGVVNQNVLGNERIGGLVGTMTGGIITKSYTTGTTVNNGRLTLYVGGLVGLCNSGTISENYSSGTIAGFQSVGGLVGHASSGCSILNNYVTGNTKGNRLGSGAGGLVGHNFGEVTNNYTSGDTNGSQFIGGLISSNHGVVKNSFTIGKTPGVPATSHTAALIGGQEGTVINSFWDKTDTRLDIMCGTDYSAGCNNLNFVENNPSYWYSKSNQPMSAWGAWGNTGNNTWSTSNGVWSICEGASLPWLTWEKRNCLIINGNSLSGTMGDIPSIKIVVDPVSGECSPRFVGPCPSGTTYTSCGCK